MMMIVLRLLLRRLPLLGLKSRWHRHFSPRPLNRCFFRGGWGVAGFVDSGPKTLVPSASNRTTPEWTLVDSCGLPPRRFDEERLRASRLLPPVDALALDLAQGCVPIRLAEFRMGPHLLGAVAVLADDLGLDRRRLLVHAAGDDLDLAGALQHVHATQRARNRLTHRQQAVV